MATTNAITALQMQAAFDDATYDGNLIQLRSGEYVYRRSEYERAAGNNKAYEYNPYKVLYSLFMTDSSGNLLDADGNIADGSTSADIDMDGDAADDTAAEWPTFYYIENVATGAKSIVHESDLLLLAGLQDLSETQGFDFTNPA